MTESSREPEENRRDWNRKVVEAYQLALAPLTRVVTSLVGLWALVYALGWKRADSYYESFGAPWLTSQLTLSDLPFFSYWPILAFTIGMMVTFTDLADRYMGKGMTPIWVVSGAAVVVLVGGGLWLGWNEQYDSSAMLYAIGLPSVATLVGLHFGKLSIELSKNAVWTSGAILKASFLAFWFLSTVGTLGSAEGKRDRHPDQTRLHFLEKTNGESARLLLIRDGFVYAAILRDDESPKIVLLSREDIRYVYKSANLPKQKDRNGTNTGQPAK